METVMVKMKALNCSSGDNLGITGSLVLGMGCMPEDGIGFWG